MVYQTPHIAASLVNTSAAEMPSSKGIVNQQIDDATYVIRTPSGDVTVLVPKDSLQPGEPVSITFRGDSVMIDRLAITPETFEKLGDLIELRLGTKIDELVTMLKDLRSSLSGELVDPELLQKLDSVIQLLEQREVDIASLLQIINEIRGAVVSQLNSGSQSSAEEALSLISNVLAFIAEKITVTGEESASASQSQVVTLSSSPEPGFWYVNNSDEALQLLLQHSAKFDAGAEKFLEAFLGKPLFIRFFESVTGAKKAFIMAPEQALVEVEHLLRSEMQSHLMKQLNPSLIVEAVIQRGDLALLQLFDMDKLIASVSASQSTPFIKEDAQNITWSQLLAIAFNSGDSKLPDFQAALTRVGSRIPALVRDILDFLNKSDSDFRLADLKKILLESMSLSNINKRDDFLPAVFRNMGYSLEQELYQASYGQSAGLQKDSPSLKLALLLILGYLNTLADGKSVTGKGGAEEEGLLRNIFSRELQSEAVKSSRPFAQPAAQPGGEPSLLRVPVEMIRQQVETILNHLESLQMLAKPTAGAEGDQQVLVLPVNIGDEWTELRVRFIKERHGKGRGKEPKHVSVTLNIDLKLLGEVTAVMEYEVKKSLNVSLTFDNEQAKKWFQKKRKDLIEALTGLGFKAIHLRVLNKRSEKKKEDFIIQKVKDEGPRFDVRG